MRLPLIALALLAAPVAAQAPQVPGQPDPARVKAGTYKIDSNHTQVAFTVTHFGFSPYHGLFGGSTGTLVLDPAKPAASKLSIQLPLDQVVTTSEKLNEHLKTPDFLDSAKFPTATFTSTSIAVNGTRAKVRGNLTLHGVTRPIELDARFVGAGVNPMSKAETIGFEATGSISRSAFGIAKYVPLVTDKVDLQITAAFERQG